MQNRPVAAFYEEVKYNQSFREKLFELRKKYPDCQLSKDDTVNFILNELIPFTKTKGFNFTIEDLVNYEKNIENVTRPLNNDDLEHISGGIGIKGIGLRLCSFSLIAGAVFTLSSQVGVRADKRAAYAVQEQERANSNDSQTDLNESEKTKYITMEVPDDSPPEGNKDPDPPQVIEIEKSQQELNNKENVDGVTPPDDGFSESNSPDMQNSVDNYDPSGAVEQNEKALDEIVRLRKEVQDLNKRVSSLQTENRNLKNTIKQYQITRHEQERQANSDRMDSNNLVNEILDNHFQEIENLKKQNQESIKVLHKTIKDLETQLEILRDQGRVKDDNIKSLEETLEEIKNFSSQRIEEFNEHVHWAVQNIDDKINQVEESYNSKLLQKDIEIDEIKAENENLKLENQNQKKHIDSLTKENEDLKRKNDSIKFNLKPIKKQLSGIQEEISTHKVVKSVSSKNLNSASSV